MRKPSLTFLAPGLFAFAASLAHAAVPMSPGASAGATGSAAAPAEVIGTEGDFYANGATAPGGTATATSPGAPRASASATPLLDRATIEAERRDERRRASGGEPRIIGIAPRTNADRTDEMPDDPIIRY